MEEAKLGDGVRWRPHVEGSWESLPDTGTSNRTSGMTTEMTHSQTDATVSKREDHTRFTWVPHKEK